MAPSSYTGSENCLFRKSHDGKNTTQSLPNLTNIITASASGGMKEWPDGFGIKKEPLFDTLQIYYSQLH